MNNQEIWKYIPNYEGYYQVSNLGRIKSLKRLVQTKNDSFRMTYDLILKPCLNARGYMVCVLCVNNHRKTWCVHQLVAITFLNHKPNGMDLVVDHINNDKLDNRVENLQIITQRENSNRKHLKSTSKYIGVYFAKDKNKWASQIVINKKTILIGRFNNEIDAHNAYQKKLKEIINKN